MAEGRRERVKKSILENTILRVAAIITAIGIISGASIKLGTMALQKELDQCRQFKCLEQTIKTETGEVIVIKDLIDEVIYLRLVSHYCDAAASYYRTKDEAQLNTFTQSQKVLAMYILQQRKCKNGDCPLNGVITSSDVMKIGQQMYMIPRPVVTLLMDNKEDR